jgi:hypothetical protein
MLNDLLSLRLDTRPLPTDIAALYEPTEITNLSFDTTRGGQIPWAFLDSGNLQITVVARVTLRHGKLARFLHGAMLAFGYAPPVGMFSRAGDAKINFALKYIPGGKHGEEPSSGSGKADA